MNMKELAESKGLEKLNGFHEFCKALLNDDCVQLFRQCLDSDGNRFFEKTHVNCDMSVSKLLAEWEDKKFGWFWK